VNADYLPRKGMGVFSILFVFIRVHPWFFSSVFSVFSVVKFFSVYLLNLQLSIFLSDCPLFQSQLITLDLLWGKYYNIIRMSV